MKTSLTVLGVGIAVPAHVTAEAKWCLESADEVLYLVPDPVAAAWITGVNVRSRALDAFFVAGRGRQEGYDAVVEEILARVRLGGKVCVAFYGHPGVFVYASHEAIARARSEGFEARMLPGVSAEDCLFADLAVDPGRAGCQSYEATDLLIHARPIDPSAGLILWQVAIIGNRDYVPDGDFSRLPVLAEYLERYYPPEHEIVCYAASPYPVCGPIIKRVQLGELTSVEIPRLASIYVPPLVRRERDAAMVDRLVQAGVAEDAVSPRS